MKTQIHTQLGQAPLVVCQCHAMYNAILGLTFVCKVLGKRTGHLTVMAFTASAQTILKGENGYSVDDVMSDVVTKGANGTVQWIVLGDNQEIARQTYIDICLAFKQPGAFQYIRMIDV